MTPTSTSLYINEAKVTPEAKAHLANHVTLRPYDAVFGDAKALSSEVAPAEKTGSPTKKFLISTKASWALSLSLGGEEKVEEVRSPVGDAKAVKNETELEGMRSCHIRDGAALSEFFAWLEEELVEKGTKLDEVEAADKLKEIRS